MVENVKRYVYKQENVVDEDQMYISADENNINMDNFQNNINMDLFQNYSLADGSNENIVQLEDGEGLTGDQYIFYDESGQAYMVDPNNNESIEFLANSSDPNICQVTYKCPLCEDSYQNANAFTKHMREKHFVKVFTCRQCEQFFDNLSLLFLHARRTHVDPKKPMRNPSSFKFHCSHCPYMTNNGGTMEHHQRAHSGIKPYKCDICDKSFAQKANMKTHRNRHIHKERSFVCDICSKSFNSHDILLAHLQTREHELQEHFQLTTPSRIQIQCMGCNEEFCSYFEVNNHSRSCDILKDLSNKFWCVLCKVGFSSSMLLKTHLKGHGGNEVIACPVCGERGFPGINQLNHHITRAHSLKVNRRIVCRYCEMTFETKVLLVDHIDDMHAAERNTRQSRGGAGRLPCPFHDCDFTSNSRMQMDRHHEQHLTNTLPASTVSRKTVVRRPRRPKQEMMEATEIEHWDVMADCNEVLRPLSDDADSIKLEMVMPDEQYWPNPGQIIEEHIDDMEVDDLEKLAASFVDVPLHQTNTDPTKRKRGRPRKFPQKSPKKQKKSINVHQNEHFDIIESYNHSLLDDYSTN